MDIGSKVNVGRGWAIARYVATELERFSVGTSDVK